MYKQYISCDPVGSPCVVILTNHSHPKHIPNYMANHIPCLSSNVSKQEISEAEYKLI
jgi:hypothetical protein